MKKKLIQTLLLGILFLFVASWFYKLICLWGIVLVWKNQLEAKLRCKYAFTLLGVFFIIGLYAVLPSYFYHTNDRIQLIYQDEKGNAVPPPISHYLMNVILPEEEIMNLGVWGARFGVRCFPYVGESILKQFQEDDWNRKISHFYHPYAKLNWSGSFMMSGTTSQVCNMMGLPKTQSVYLVKPRTYNPHKKYPVVFFCHGGLGNWKLYQGLWKDLEDCIVLSVGTRDWSGIYGFEDIKALFTRQLPFLSRMGYKVDESQLHIMGLSNGGSAVNMAYAKFANRFKSITFLSIGIHQTHSIDSKIIMVGGGKDGSSRTLRSAYRKLKSNETQTALFWDPDETHFILVNQQSDVLRFLKKEMLNQ